MIHASPEEIHDHAYGFRLSDHVATCPDCRRAADAVTAERASLRDAIAEEVPLAPEELVARLGSSKPGRVKVAPAALAAAALLLVALAWILLQSPIVPYQAKAPVRLSLDAEIDRLIAELQSPLPLHREIARLALKKFGGITIEKLEKAQVDPALIDECRGLSPADQVMIRKLQSIRVTVDFNNAPITACLDYVREVSGLNFHISGVDNPDRVNATFKLQNATVAEVLDRLKAETRLPYWVRDGVVMVGVERPTPNSAAPIRILAIRDWAVRQPGELLRSKPEALTVLARLCNAADPALWDFLDSPDADLRDLSWGELRRLYDPPALLPRVSPLTKILDEKKIDASFENVSPFEILDYLAQSGGISLLVSAGIDFPADRKVTFKVKDLVLKNVLKLLLSQFLIDFLSVDDLILVTSPDGIHAWGNPPAPFWASIEEAGAAESLIDDLASSDLVRQESARARGRELGRPALKWLAHAALILEGDAAQRCVSLRRELAEGQGIWIVDHASGAQTQTLSVAQKALLDRPLTLNSNDRSLETILKGEGIPSLFKKKIDQPLLLCAHGLKLGSLLKAATRPQGMDFYLDGATIVIDTAANVRSAVGQK